MSVPATLMSGPYLTRTLLKRRYLLIYFFLIWLSILPIQLEIWLYYNLLFYSDQFSFLLYLPLLFLAMYISAIFTSLIGAKFLLLIANKINLPKEGNFKRDYSDKDFRYWVIRSVIKRWPIWLSHKFPYPFMNNICFKLFGVKTKFSNSLFEGWVDTEFIDFGKDVVVGQGSIVQSALIIGDLLIIRKVTIEDNVRIGAHSLIMPGTKMGSKSILASASMTTIGQELEGEWIYAGVPAKKYKPNYYFEDQLEEIMAQGFQDVESLRKKYEELYERRHDQNISVKERLRKIKEKLK